MMNIMMKWPDVSEDIWERFRISTASSAEEEEDADVLYTGDDDQDDDEDEVDVKCLKDEEVEYVTYGDCGDDEHDDEVDVSEDILERFRLSTASSAEEEEDADVLYTGDDEHDDKVDVSEDILERFRLSTASSAEEEEDADVLYTGDDEVDVSQDIWERFRLSTASSAEEEEDADVLYTGDDEHDDKVDVSEDIWERFILSTDSSAEEEEDADVLYTGDDEDEVDVKCLKDEKWIKHYCSVHKILLVGEGDFSFSACLAKAFGSATNMIATSLDSEGFLEKNYSHAISNIQELKNRGCKVNHEFDATKMVNYSLLQGVTFDRIVYNFPHAGFFKNETRHSQITRHQTLIRLFFMNAKRLISWNGEIHVSHKCNGFFLEWNIQALAQNAGLVLVEEVNFRLSDYPGYCTKYGYGGGKDFNCHPSKTYKFGLP